MVSLVNGLCEDRLFLIYTIFWLFRIFKPSMAFKKHVKIFR